MIKNASVPFIDFLLGILSDMSYILERKTYCDFCSLSPHACT